jgi:hypothetical protein
MESQSTKNQIKILNFEDYIYLSSSKTQNFIYKNTINSFVESARIVNNSVFGIVIYKYKE